LRNIILALNTVRNPVLSIAQSCIGSFLFSPGFV
jgi:hypothetical protein